MALDEGKRRILEAIRERYGDVALPPIPEKMPEEYWQEAAKQISSLPGVRQGQPSFMERALGGVTAPFRAFDRSADSPASWVSPLHAAYKFGWSPAYDAAIQPTLDRAEDVGELLGSPIVQQVWDARPGGPSPGALPNTPLGMMGILPRYRAGAEGFFENIRPETGGIDFRGAVDAATDRMQLDPYVAGTAGILLDPTNIIPGRAFTGAPAAVGRIARQAGEAGAGAAVRQTGREAVRAAQEFPGALAKDVEDVGRLGAAAGRGMGRAAVGAGRLAAEGAQGLAMMPFGAGGVGGGGRRAGGDWTPSPGNFTWQEMLSNARANRKAAQDKTKVQRLEKQVRAAEQRMNATPTRQTSEFSKARNAFRAAETRLQSERDRLERLIRQAEVWEQEGERLRGAPRQETAAPQQPVAGETPTTDSPTDIADSNAQRWFEGAQAVRRGESLFPPQSAADEPGSAPRVNDAYEPSIEEVAAGLPPAQAQRVRDELLSDAPDLVSGPSAFKRAYMEARRAGQNEQQAVDAAFAADRQSQVDAGQMDMFGGEPPAAAAPSGAGAFKLRFRSGEEAAGAPDFEALEALPPETYGMIRRPEDAAGAEDMIIVDADDIERGYLASSETNPNKLAIFSEDGDVLGEFDTFEEANAAIKALPPDAFDAPPASPLEIRKQTADELVVAMDAEAEGLPPYSSNPYSIEHAQAYKRAAMQADQDQLAAFFDEYGHRSRFPDDSFDARLPAASSAWKERGLRRDAPPASTATVGAPPRGANVVSDAYRQMIEEGHAPVIPLRRILERIRQSDPSYNEEWLRRDVQILERNFPAVTFPTSTATRSGQDVFRWGPTADHDYYAMRIGDAPPAAQTDFDKAKAQLNVSRYPKGVSFAEDTGTYKALAVQPPSKLTQRWRIYTRDGADTGIEQAIEDVPHEGYTLYDTYLNGERVGAGEDATQAEQRLQRMLGNEPPPAQQMDASGQAGWEGLATRSEGQMSLGMQRTGGGMTPRAQARLEEHRIRMGQDAEAARQQQIEGQEYGADYGAQAEMEGTPAADLTPRFGAESAREPTLQLSEQAELDMAAAVLMRIQEAGGLVDHYDLVDRIAQDGHALGHGLGPLLDRGLITYKKVGAQEWYVLTEAGMRPDAVDTLLAGETRPSGTAAAASDWRQRIASREYDQTTDDFTSRRLSPEIAPGLFIDTSIRKNDPARAQEIVYATRRAQEAILAKIDDYGEFDWSDMTGGGVHGTTHDANVSLNANMDLHKMEDAALHEAAHVIANRLHPRSAAHGREWQRIAREIGVETWRTQQVGAERARVDAVLRERYAQRTQAAAGGPENVPPVSAAAAPVDGEQRVVLNLGDVVRRREFQRRNTGSDLVNEQHIKNLGKWDPVQYQRDPGVVWMNPETGKYELLMGYHRTELGRRAGETELPFRVFEGTYEEAKLAAGKSNRRDADLTTMEKAELAAERAALGWDNAGIAADLNITQVKEINHYLNLWRAGPALREIAAQNPQFEAVIATIGEFTRVEPTELVPWAAEGRLPPMTAHAVFNFVTENGTKPANPVTVRNKIIGGFNTQNSASGGAQLDMFEGMPDEDFTSAFIKALQLNDQKLRAAEKELERLKATRALFGRVKMEGKDPEITNRLLRRWDERVREQEQVVNDLSEGKMADYRASIGMAEPEPAPAKPTRRNKRKVTPRTPADDIEEALEETPSAPTAPPVTVEEVTNASTPEEIQSVIGREIIEAAETPADPLSRLPADPPPPSDGSILPEDAYRVFTQQTEQRQLAELRTRVARGEDLTHLIEGARRIAGDVEAQRLQELATADVAPARPERTPIQPEPEAEIPREPEAGEFAGRGGGGGRRGGRGGRSERERFGEGEYGGEVPVPGAGFSIPTLSTATEKIRQMRSSTTWSWMAEQLSQRVKGSGAAIRLVNPSARADDAPVVTRMKIAQEALRDEVDHNWQPLFAWLDEIGSESAVFGQADEAGQVTATLKGERSGQQAQVYIQQIAENRGRYVLSELQEQWLDRADAVSQVSRDYLKRIGQRFEDFNPGDGSNYTGLLLVAKRNEAGEIVDFGYVAMSDRRGLAGKAAFVKQRQFQTLEEALEAGLLPEPSYRRALWVRAGMAGRQAVRARMSAYLAEHLKEARAGGEVQVHRGLYDRTPRRGETPEWREAIEERLGGENYGRKGPPPPKDVSLPAGHHIIDLQLYTERKGLTRKQLRISGPEAEKIAEFTEQLKYEAELKQANWALRWAARIGHEARLMVLTLDASVFFIQGLSAVLAHPSSLYRKGGQLPKDAVRGFYQALRDPEIANQARAAMMSRFASEGGYYSHPNLITTYGGYSEFTEALQEGGLVRRIPKVGDALERAGTAFDYVRDIVAVELARFGDEVGMGAAELAEHDKIINAMLGRLSSRTLGIGQDQRMAESVLLLAPQYFRATIGLLARATAGGMSSKMTSRMVAKSMGLYMALIAAAGYTLGTLRGDSEEAKMREVMRSLNPTAGEWLSVRAGDVRIGFAGMPRALMAFIGEMIVGEEFRTDDEKYGGGLVGQRMNTLGRFFASRPGPALTMAYQGAAMRDFVGVDTSPGVGWLRIMANHGLPISIQEVIETFDAENLPMMLGKTAAAGLGLNVRDLGLTDIRERATAQIFPGKLYGEIESWQRDYVNAQIAPEIDRIRQRRTSSQADNVSSSNVGIIASEAKAEREMKLLRYATDMTMDPGALYFSWVRADAFEHGQQDTAGELYDLLFDDRPPDVPENELEQAYQDWQAIRDEPNRQRRDQLYAAFDQQYPANTKVGRYIRSKTNRRRVPYALLQRLSNYSKAKGVWASVLARHSIMQEDLQAGGMPPDQARAAADAYSNWFLMVDDTEAYAEAA